MVYRIQRASLYSKSTTDNRIEVKLYALCEKERKFGKERIYSDNFTLEERLYALKLKSLFGKAKNLINKTGAHKVITNDARLIGDAARHVGSGFTSFVSGARHFKYNKEGIKGALSRLKNGGAEMLAGRAAAAAGTFEKVGAKAESLLNDYGAYLGHRAITEYANKIGVKNIATYTPYADMAKGYAKKLNFLRKFRKDKNFRQELVSKFKDKVNRAKGTIALNPGKIVADEGSKIVGSGGARLEDHAVNLGKVLETGKAAVTHGLPGALNAAHGYWDVEVARTAADAAIKTAGKGASRLATFLRGKPVDLEKAYFNAAEKAGKYIKEPLNKFVNTAGAAAQMATTGVMPGYVHAGAPMMTGKTFKRVGSVIKTKANNVFNNIREGITESLPTFRVRRLQPSMGI